MDRERELRFQRTLENRSNRLGVSKEELVEIEKEPKFLESARSRADEVGMSVGDVLREDLERMLESDYPGADCLQPDDVEEYIVMNELSQDSLSHIDTCHSCNALLLAAHPKEEKLELLFEHIRYDLAQVTAKSEREQSTEDIPVSGAFARASYS
jgi:hypothetical protein